MPAHLALDEDPTARLHVAQNGKTPAGSTAWLALWLAFKSEDPKELARLAECPDLRVKAQVARNPHTPPHVLFRLAEENPHNPPFMDYQIHTCLAQNPSSPPSLLERLVERALQDDSPTADRVLRTVAEREDCPEELLRRIAERESRTVRMAVLSNGACPEDVRRKLAKDPDRDVRKAARSHYKAPFDLLLEEAHETLAEGARLPIGLHTLLLQNLDRLPHDFSLWEALLANSDEKEKERIETHPFGKQVALLARLGG